MPTAVVLIDPKYPQNVGAVQRTCSCYGTPTLIFSGTRVSLEPHAGYRLPREERMKGYKDVMVSNELYPVRYAQQVFGDYTPVAVEVRENAEKLPHFVHPEKALYFFGPEDGTLPGVVLATCHRFVVIPTKHCLNLSHAVATILYDRHLKKELQL